MWYVMDFYWIHLILGLIIIFVPVTVSSRFFGFSLCIFFSCEFIHICSNILVLVSETKIRNKLLNKSGCCSVIQLVANKGWYSDKRKINTTYIHYIHHKEHNYLDNRHLNYVILLLWTNSSGISHYNILGTFKGFINLKNNSTNSFSTIFILITNLTFTALNSNI
jgi:hypothetical protein